MMLVRKLSSALIVIQALLVVPASASDAPPLKHNPFARPPAATAAGPGPGPVFSEFAGEAGVPLTATLVSKEGGLANVAGRIIRPGDEVDGYRLLEVFEDRAVFVKGAKKTTVYVKPELTEDDE